MINYLLQQLLVKLHLTICCTGAQKAAPREQDVRNQRKIEKCQYSKYFQASGRFGSLERRVRHNDPKIISE